MDYAEEAVDTTMVLYNVDDSVGESYDNTLYNDKEAAVEAARKGLGL